MPDPEQIARQEIDALLGPCGWVVQDKNAVNLAAARGVAVRELSFKTGEPDYTLFVDGKAIGRGVNRRRDASATVSEENIGAEENQSRDGSATFEDSYETGAQLLERILTERREKWNGKGKYREPAKAETTNLPPLPEGWTWARLDAMAALKGGITVDKNRKSPTARRVPYLRVANVQRGHLDLSDLKEIEAPESDIEELWLVRGDILFTEGGDRDKLGRGWIWEGQVSECIHQNHIFRARLYAPMISPKFVSWWGNSFGHFHFLREGKQTTNLASINLSKLSEFPIPIPPVAEQQRIVAEVERRLSVLDELESVVNANFQRAIRLRQSILGEAFSGSFIQRSN